LTVDTLRLKWNERILFLRILKLNFSGIFHIYEWKKEFFEATRQNHCKLKKGFEY
jgi:hypothetical protein